MPPSVLVPIAPEFEELEAVAPVDLLRRAGAEVVLASVGPDRWVTGRSGLRLETDLSLGEVLDRNFDCIFLPGGPGVRHLRADPRISDLVRRQAARGAWVAAICAAPLVLQDVGLLQGRHFTAHFSVAVELPARLGNERTVQDGRILTGRGAGTAIDFGLALVAHLFSAAKSAEVAAAVGA